MIRFERDYCEGAHPSVMELLLKTNMEQSDGYGEDEYCRQAKALIRRLCEDEHAHIYFVSGGTQANATVIAGLLRPYEGVLSPDTGHINGHEAGAIEGRGHKVLALPNVDGKITARQAEAVLSENAADPKRNHSVQPGMVYISHPTECGTLYTKAELEALSAVCRKWAVPLFMDGARLGYGLAAPESDLTLPEIARLCDVFYIGGTKVGALLGEAIVITGEAYKKDFQFMIKHMGALLAKGRVLGIQFLALLQDGVYFEIAAHANRLAMEIKAALLECGVPLYVDSPTNQQFPIFTDAQREALEEMYAFSPWETLPDGRRVVRICTSWATKPENVRQMVADIREVCG